MNQTIREFKRGEYTVKIVPDEDPTSPIEWDNFGTMVCAHKRYDLGHKRTIDPMGSSIELVKEIDPKVSQKKLDQCAHPDDVLDLCSRLIWLPLYLYDHSGLRIATSPFSCPWDSGRIGFIYTTVSKARKSLGIHKGDIAKPAKEVMSLEVETYDDYLSGSVVCGELWKGDELIESIGGYYPDRRLLRGRSPYQFIADELFTN